MRFAKAANDRRQDRDRIDVFDRDPNGPGGGAALGRGGSVEGHPQRAEEGAYVWQKLLKSGAIVTNGTDAPVEDIEALGGRVDTYKHDPGRFRERSMDHTEHVRLMLDILLLSLQTDSTRVATLLLCRDLMWEEA